MTKTIGARGLTCPAPVLMVREVLQKDNPDALEDLVAYEKQGLTI